jgi:glycosyltransferase involved in cell wall biosynthesis
MPGNGTICFFNSMKAWGGGEKWHYDISCSLHLRGWKTLVVTNKKSVLYSKLGETGQKLYNIKITNLSFLNPFKILLLRKIFIRENTGIIIINLSADLKVAGVAAKLAGVKRIIYRRGSAIPIKNRWLNRFIFRNIVTEIIANSQETKKTVLQNNQHLFPSGKIKVIYNGIDIKNYDLNNKNALYNRMSDEIILGNLGRIVNQKGQRYLVDMAVELKKSNLDFKILIGGEGPLMGDLKAYAGRMGVSDRVIFLGFVNNVIEFMNSIDIFLLTSLWEGFGYVIIEAMLCSKPVVAFNVSSNPELIDDGRTGFLVEFGNTGDFTGKVEMLLRDKKLRSLLGEQAHADARKKFSIEAVVSELEDFLCH